MFEVGTVMVMAVAAVREDLCSRIMTEDNSKEKKKLRSREVSVPSRCSMLWDVLASLFS